MMVKLVMKGETGRLEFDGGALVVDGWVRGEALEVSRQAMEAICKLAGPPAPIEQMGLGDTVASVLKRVGFGWLVKWWWPSCACKARQAVLNRWVPYNWGVWKERCRGLATGVGRRLFTRPK